MFMDSLIILMNDSSMRDLGFNAKNNRYFTTIDGQYNRLAEFALALMAHT